MFTTRNAIDALLRSPDTYTSNKVFNLGTVSTSPLAFDPTQGNVFTLTPGASLTINAASVVAGQEVAIIVTTSGSSSFTLTFGTNFKTTGTLATGTVSAKIFVIQFISDGTNYIEVSRTTAI